MPPALSRGCFLEGGGTFCQREKVPPPSALYWGKSFCKRRHGPQSLQVCSDPSVRDMPILCKASELHTRRTSPFPACCRPAQPLRDRRLLRRGPMRHPCLSVDTGTVLPSDGPGSPLSAVSFLSALRTSPSGSCRRRAGIGPYLPFAPRKGRRRRHRPLPAKNRNFLDLWQTIAQDLSRLFAVPGGCPSCLGSRKDWPEPLSRFRRPVPAPSLLPAAFRKALCTVWPEHDAHADTDMGHGRAARPSTVQPLHGTGGPERDGCPGRCDTVAWT